MSLYLRQPGVPRVHIGAYPKRRPSWVKAPVVEAERLLTAVPASRPAPSIPTQPAWEPCYADFLRDPQQHEQHASSAA